MALEHLEGTTYGPIEATLSAAKVAEYVVATGDDPDRWDEAAPPGYAGALLFTVAPMFLASGDVAAHTAVLVHADQTFIWHAPLRTDRSVTLTGRVDRVRARGGLDFVSFVASVVDTDGSPLLDSTSTFLLGAQPAGEPPSTRAEPPVRLDAGFDDDLEAPADGSWSPVSRSASRLDLVRYAAASGDFNPIHFDHDAAVGAGLPGVVVHGLMMGAWLIQPAAMLRPGPRPLERAKLRFRDPLFPAERAVLDGTLSENGREADLRLRRAADDTVLVTAQVKVAGE